MNACLDVQVGNPIDTTAGHIFRLYNVVQRAALTTSKRQGSSRAPLTSCLDLQRCTTGAACWITTFRIKGAHPHHVLGCTSSTGRCTTGVVQPICYCWRELRLLYNACTRYVGRFVNGVPEYGRLRDPQSTFGSGCTTSSNYLTRRSRTALLYNRALPDMHQSKISDHSHPMT
jgi:hypothetical protein